MALPTSLNQRNFDKFIEDSTGKAAVRVVPVDAATVSTFLSGSKTVAVAGTPEALAASTAISGVLIQAQVTNTGNITVGTNTSQDVILFPGDSVSISVDNLANVYIDSTVNGEGVNYIAT